MNTPKKDIKVLLVEDTPEFRDLLSDMLGVLGYTQIQEAGNGHMALELAKNYQPNLVLMDTRMPGLLGPEVCMQMRQEDYGKMAAILGMSNDENPTLKDAWLNAGADNFFLKDIEPDDLARIIEEALKKYQQ